MAGGTVRSTIAQSGAKNWEFTRVQAKFCLCAGLLIVPLLHSQTITVDTRTGTFSNGNTTTETVDRRYQQVKPTHVPLSSSPLDNRTRLELIRNLEAEQGFAMRPLPRGHKGLTLTANGPLDPYGEAYLQMITSQGTAVKPGERVFLSDIKVEKNHLLIDLNGGPDSKHRFLSHVQIGMGNGSAPVASDEVQPSGARITLTFEKSVPTLTAKEVKALLEPLVSFDVKTPIQAFTDTLPTKLKDAILGHQVLVGMTTEMVLFAKGKPESRIHESEGDTPFDEWIYGKAPAATEFVRFNGNRVIRLEVARVGEAPEVFTKDEVAGLMRTDGSALTTIAEHASGREQTGDVQRDPDRQAPAAPPSLRLPGETLPEDSQREGVMKPVHFPKPADTTTSNRSGEAEPPKPQESEKDTGDANSPRVDSEAGRAAPK